MAHPFMIMMTGVCLGSFFATSAIAAYFHIIGVTGLLTFAHIKDHDRLIKVGRILNVVMTGIDFLCIFATDTSIKN